MGRSSNSTFNRDKLLLASVRIFQAELPVKLARNGHAVIWSSKEHDPEAFDEEMRIVGTVRTDNRHLGRIVGLSSVTLSLLGPEGGSLTVVETAPKNFYQQPFDNYFADRFVNAYATHDHDICLASMAEKLESQQRRARLLPPRPSAAAPQQIGQRSA